MKFDSKDKQIIELLKQDSRASIRELSKKTGIRPSTIHQRITKLRQNNVIEKFTIKLNTDVIGENFVVFMLVNTTKDVSFKDPCIKEVSGITGEYDILLKMRFKDANEFNKFIIRFRKQEGVVKTLTMVSTANFKEES